MESESSAAIIPHELVRTRQLESVHLKFNQESGTLLPLCLRYPSRLLPPSSHTLLLCFSVNHSERLAFADAPLLDGRSMKSLSCFCFDASPGVACSTEDTSRTKVSTETPLLPLCRREWRELLPPRSTRMRPTGPGFRYCDTRLRSDTHTHTRLRSAAAFHLTRLIPCCLDKDPVD